ncbi:MAG: peptidogalycan biosysnthesis protein, partial [Oscillospiraceae bacterium]
MTLLSHAFLSALETSGSVGLNSGWQPCHMLLLEGHVLVAAMPLYLKQHSYGEYVFDWAWADAYERAGVDYYPKLLSAIPFTPITSERLLTTESRFQQLLIDALENIMRS